MKKIIVALCLFTVLLVPMFAQGQNEGITIGSAIYKFDDTFMTSVRNAISDASVGKATVDIVDSENSQAK